MSDLIMSDKIYTIEKYDIFVCHKCYNDTRSLVAHINFKKNKYFLNATKKLLLMNQVDDKIIPNGYCDNITNNRTKIYMDMLNYITYCDPLLGSVKEWAMFTDQYDIPYYIVSTAL